EAAHTAEILRLVGIDPRCRGMPQGNCLLRLAGCRQKLREIDGSADIAYLQVLRWSFAQKELLFDERNRAVEFSSPQRVVAQCLALPQLAVVAVAAPARLIVCRESRTSPIAFVHRQQSHFARAWRHPRDYVSLRLLISQI